MRRRQIHALPFTGLAFASLDFGPRPTFVAVTLINQSYFCIRYDWPLKQVVAFAATFEDFDRGQYSRDASQHTLEHEVAALKAWAITHGATLEAIQLLGLLTPLTKKEELEMATANPKLSRKAADTEGLKTAAKAAPVKATAPKAAPKVKNPLPDAPAAAPAKKKGNVEALAKAREARANTPKAPDKRKITKLKANPGREGTGAHARYAELLKHKTVQSALDNENEKLNMADINYAVKAGVIELT